MRIFSITTALRTIAIVATILIIFSSPNPASAQTAPCQPNNPNLKYFGYYGVTSEESISEITNMQNTNIILTSGWGDPTRYDNYNGKFLIDLRSGMLGDANQVFYSDWETVGIERLRQSVARYNDRVYAFYIDEPYFNNISPQLFRAVTQKLRDTFPTIGFLAIEAYPPILNHSIPSDYYEYVTDLGFDYYFTHYDASNDLGWQKYQEIHTAFEPYLVGKKLWVIPDGHAPSLVVPYERWFDSFERYICFANSQPAATGVLNFIYKTFPQYIELRDLIHPTSSLYNAAFSERHLSVGSYIVSKSMRQCPTYIDEDNDGYCLNNSGTCAYYGNGCFKTITCTSQFTSCTPIGTSNDRYKPGDLNHDGVVNYADFSELISNFGTTYSIADFNDIIINYGQ